jgi:UDP-2-acetamido-2,6-beta-L-arabino-hexul-4-ose reductase
LQTIHSQLKVIKDSKGVLFEPLSAEEIIGKKNVHVVISNPGIVRGNHYHLQGEETMAVTGPALVRFRQGDEDIDVDVPENEVYRFVFPPHVPHAIKNTGNASNLLIAFNTIEHDRSQPDTVTEILI